MFSFFVFLIIVGVVIIVHEFGHFIIAKRWKVRVDEFSVGFGPKIAKRKRNETEYSISAIPLGGYVKMAGDNPEEFKGKPYEFLAQPCGARAQVIFFGPLLNYFLGFLCFCFIYLAFPTPMITTKVGGLVEGFPAGDAGIQVGDTVISLGGKKVDYWDDIQAIIQNKKAGSVVNMVVVRDGLSRRVALKTKAEEIEDIFGQKRSIGLIGIKPAEEIKEVRYGFLESVFQGGRKTVYLTAMTYKALWSMVTGKLSLRDSLAGPLGFFYITSKYAKEGIVAILHLLAVLSINLCIFNLLPLPVLDGGHLVLLALEKIRGRRLSPQTDMVVTRIGLSIIIALAIIATGIDLMRLIGRK
ncbi:MAG: RIP metalloprotease RseP [Candidatus Omnitrophota bacterium]|jgi:regulator of sigma E protease|nr:MAG: RIP metalloprotease RseP [Candidatus Omnitrophota bacterium]